jgi:hypothetical protein
MSAIGIVQWTGIHRDWTVSVSISVLAVIWVIVQYRLVHGKCHWLLKSDDIDQQP